ncbi:MAG TPA: N-acetylmuramoyl-L-alanine amidase [Solirubrobacter sp.]|nr:N-acetylmuramoyl-L-alanine amidase [Solirubrobacter sp.]
MLLIENKLVPVEGLDILPPAEVGGPMWCRLDPGDYAPRRTPWVRMIIVHTTGGLWPQQVIPGAGRPGHAKEIADMWRGADRGGGERVHSAAQLVVDFDGTVACLCDLFRCAAYHAEASNQFSIGIEMCTHPDGSIQEATLKAASKLVDALCWPLFPIPRQMVRGPYRGLPLQRMEAIVAGRTVPRLQIGGPDCVGVFGHRDQTSARGRGDPGDAIFGELAALGFEAWDFEAREDLLVAKERQAHLNSRGARLLVDGLVGAKSLLAAENQGYPRWADVPRS